jgi:hypothetical protein
VHYTDNATLPLTQWRNVGVAASDETETTLTSLTPDTTYYYRIRAVSDRGDGVLSPLQWVKTGHLRMFTFTLHHLG